MDALILSCSTGGGHNSAARAMVKELSGRGWNVTFFDPYTLRSQRMSDTVGQTYVNIVKFSPAAFGGIYRIGQIYQKAEKAFGLPDPVLLVQKKTAIALYEYLQKNPVDLILCSHPYPGLMLTWLKDHGYSVPPCMMIPTDYTCIPFESDVQTDWMSVPHPDLQTAFHKEGVAYSRMLPLGIPVDSKFDERIPKAQAARALGLPPGRRYILIGGGSMGINGIWPILRSLRPLIDTDDSLHLLVLTGSNKSIYRKIEALQDPAISPVPFTRNMFEYLQLASLYITKPGGLSITEAAAAGVPLLLCYAIPGCETENAKFFEERGFALYARSADEIPGLASRLLTEEKTLVNAPHDPFFSHISARFGDWCDLAASLNAKDFDKAGDTPIRTLEAKKPVPGRTHRRAGRRVRHFRSALLERMNRN